jgi:hypothetical protein
MKSILGQRIAGVKSRNPYFAKDVEKANRARKFIGRGSSSSSTDAYRLAAGGLANCGLYTKTDIVFVSAEGARVGRIDPDATELDLAIEAGVMFITDDLANRSRPYNVGERQVAHYLTAHGYAETEPGVWKPKSKPKSKSKSKAKDIK